MSALSRRAFVAQAAALLPVAQLALADSLKKNNLGVQLYTVRNIIGNDAAGVLNQIHSIGYSEVEMTEATLKDAWSAVQSSGLKAPSIHLDLDPSDEVLADVKSKGFEYAVIPYIPPNRRGGADVIKALADQFQKVAQRAKAHGLILCYHNHAFEYQEMNGTTGLDIIMQVSDLKLELDIFWATVAGQNPVDLLKKYHGRVPLLHLKDKEKGVPAATQYNENVPKDAFKEIGNGSIDIPAVLKAANKAGVKHYFVEQDQSPDPIASLKQSYAYLSKHFA